MSGDLLEDLLPGGADGIAEWSDRRCGVVAWTMAGGAAFVAVLGFTDWPDPGLFDYRPVSVVIQATTPRRVERQVQLPPPGDQSGSAE